MEKMTPNVKMYFIPSKRMCGDGVNSIGSGVTRTFPVGQRLNSFPTGYCTISVWLTPDDFICQGDSSRIDLTRPLRKLEGNINNIFEWVGKKHKYPTIYTCNCGNIILTLVNSLLDRSTFHCLTLANTRRIYLLKGDILPGLVIRLLYHPARVLGWLSEF